MPDIHFKAIVDQDQIIRPPTGITLPRGEIEVTVRPLHPERSPSADELAATRTWLLELASDAEQANPNLPKDLAEQHDHYAHGKPR